MESKYEFDARRYCFNNKNRLGHLADGTPCADMIICELDSRAVLIEALKRNRDELRARLDAVEAQRDGLRKLVMAVSVKYPHIDTGDVDGKNWFDARDEAIAQLEANNGK